MLVIQAQSGDITKAKVDVLVVNLFEMNASEEKAQAQSSGGTGAVDKALGGLLSEEFSRKGGFKGKLADTFVLHTHHKIPARYVVVVGLGKADDLTGQKLRRASAAAARAVRKLKVTSAASLLHGAGQGGMNPESAARLFAEGTHLGLYKFELLKSKFDQAKSKAKGKAKLDQEASQDFQTLTVYEKEKAKLSAIETGLALGTVIAEQVNHARDWVFDTPNRVTPTFLMKQAKAIKGLTCEVLGMSEMQKLGMGALTMVAKGSVEAPYLIHLSYVPKGKPKKKVALVGKGITFDSGGLSLKPAGSMELMKNDMAGAAAVLATMGAIARLKNLNIQVDAFIPTCENMPSGHASRPGDVVSAMNGKTIEVNNTDAEGRLVLADALTYGQRTVQPDEVIDLATLTGACVVTLGKVASGIMGTNDDLIQGIRKAGESAGEKYWELPLYEEYAERLKSDVADLINAGAKGEAGSSMGGMFLKEFIEDNRPWAHLDIAGPAYVSSDQPEVPKGATGVGVRTLLYYLYQWDAN